MKLPLGALLVFIGYSVLWTGFMNMRVTFSANPGGDPKPSAHQYSLWEAITCNTPTLQGQPDDTTVGGAAFPKSPTQSSGADALGPPGSPDRPDAFFNWLREHL